MQSLLRSPSTRSWTAAAVLIAIGVLSSRLDARPRYRQNLKRYYGDALAAPLDACTTCHLRNAAPLATAPAEAGAAGAAAPAEMPPHNPFGARLRALGKELESQGKPSSLPARLRAAALEDADGDGVANEVEILSGRSPGDPADLPAGAALAAGLEKQRAFAREASRDLWEPLQPVVRPAVPALERRGWARNPIDEFIAREHEARGLAPRPEAPKHVLLRRATLDLTGLAPDAEEFQRFLDDDSPDAYEKLIDRLLASPRHGERWGRHWMDVWRYSDWAGWGEQVRDSQPHVWRWRDWIVESLNADKGYDRMVLEMLAGDELAPGDKDTLRATGYLARSFKLLSREAWMQEAVDHLGMAFLGSTVGCARCHDHMYDPISQREYYELRAVFEPYQVRLDRMPGELDTKKDGLPRVFDGAPDAKTYVFIRGDDRQPDKERPLAPNVPAAFGGPRFRPEPVSLPLTAYAPDKEDHVVRDTIAEAEKAVRDARAAFEQAMLKAAKPAEGAADPKLERAARLAEMALPLAEAKLDALRATLRVERMEDAGERERDPGAWKAAAIEATKAQRWARLLEARRNALAAQFADEDAAAGSEAAKKAKEELSKAREALEKAKAEAILEPTEEYARREIKVYPAASTGRRLALARWIADRRNPLAARVAANHIWLRHFGRAIVPSVADFGLNGQRPTHPELLDWLAAELMEPSAEPAGAPWSMKRLHRLLVTSAAYRMASTPDEKNAAADPDNRYLWRMPSRRLEAEAVRDNVLHVAGRLDEACGGPELDCKLILSSNRRSIYYRHAAEKQAEFLKIFDAAQVSECYERRSSVVPQQALALANSELAFASARRLARDLAAAAAGDAGRFVEGAFVAALSRRPTDEELRECLTFLSAQEKLFRERAGTLQGAAGAGELQRPSIEPALRARENLAHALLNHSDFVTVR